MTTAKQLKIKEFPFIIKDSNGKEIYYEDSDGFWLKYEYDAEGNRIYLESSYGFWSKREYDAEGNEIYFEDSHGFWSKREYDAEGKVIYFEDSHGVIKDNHPKTEIQKAIELLTKEGLLVDGKILKN